MPTGRILFSIVRAQHTFSISLLLVMDMGILHLTTIVQSLFLCVSKFI